MSHAFYIPCCFSFSTSLSCLWRRRLFLDFPSVRVCLGGKSSIEIFVAGVLTGKFPDGKTVLFFFFPLFFPLFLTQEQAVILGHTKVWEGVRRRRWSRVKAVTCRAQIVDVGSGNTHHPLPSSSNLSISCRTLCRVNGGTSQPSTTLHCSASGTQPRALCFVLWRYIWVSPPWSRQWGR